MKGAVSSTVSPWLGVCVCVAAAMVAGCSKGHFSEKSNATKGNVFRYPIPTKPTSMDPGNVQDGDTIDLLQQVYEGLVGWGEDNQVHPRLAEKWDISKDGMTYTFHLRTDAKFSNGRPVTASDFKWCIDRNCNMSPLPETVKDYLKNIVGVMDVVNGNAKTVSGITVVDDHTLRMQIDKPRMYFLSELTYPVSFVFDRNVVKDPKHEITRPEEMIGTGGFKFDVVKPDQIVTLKANDLYYEGRPPLDAIERPYVPDASTRLAMYKNGQIDLVQLERQDLGNLQSDPQFSKEIHFFPRPSIFYIGINCAVVPALKDARVRRAMAMAIDKDKICKDNLGGMNPRADCILPPDVFGHRDTVKSIPYDPEGAKKLLAEAGYPNGQGIPQLEMSYRNNRPDIQIVAQAVGQDLERNLGIKTTFRALEWATYLGYHNKKQLPFFHMRWAADYLDAENFLSTLLASYGNENKINYSNPQYDALCAKADTSLNPQERLALYAQAEDIVLQDAPFIPIYFQRDAELISSRVSGIRESLFGHLPHTKLSLK